MNKNEIPLDTRNKSKKKEFNEQKYFPTSELLLRTHLDQKHVQFSRQSRGC